MTVTERRDLRTGVSYWQARPARSVRAERLVRDVETDVIVIGAGITGAVIAESLAPRHRVAIVDRRGAASGATLASTALVVYEIDQPLTRLSRIVGEDAAARAWRRSYLAVGALADRTRALGIPCDAERRDNLYLAGTLLDAAALRDEAEARRAIGLETRFVSKSELKKEFGMARPAALLGYSDLAVDPRRMTLGYLRAAGKNGARLFAPVDISQIEIARGGVTAVSRHGPTIRARYLVFATGYELPCFALPGSHQLVSTYAIATRPQRRRAWPKGLLMWEASEPYLYARGAPDGSVICGGEDDDFADATARDRRIGSKAQRIARKLSRIAPALDTAPVFAWAGTFGTTDTGLPLIGRLPGKSNCWIALGFGGNGITYARIAADVIAADLDGRADPDAELYSPARASPTKGAP